MKATTTVILGITAFAGGCWFTSFRKGTTQSEQIVPQTSATLSKPVSPAPPVELNATAREQITNVLGAVKETHAKCRQLDDLKLAIEGKGIEQLPAECQAKFDQLAYEIDYFYTDACPNDFRIAAVKYRQSLADLGRANGDATRYAIQTGNTGTALAMLLDKWAGTQFSRATTDVLSANATRVVECYKAVDDSRNAVEIEAGKLGIFL